MKDYMAEDKEELIGVELYVTRILTCMGANKEELRPLVAHAGPMYVS